MQVFKIYSMVGSRSGGMEEAGLAVIVDGQAVVMVKESLPETVIVDYEFTSQEDAGLRVLPQVESLVATRDSVRSFTELYALATAKYGWDPDAERVWREMGPVSAIGAEQAGKPLKKPKGFVREKGPQDD